MDCFAALLDAKRRLRAAGCDTPELDADLLFARALNTDRGGLLLRRGTALSAEERQTAEALTQRRERREPVAYILGEKEFYSLMFEVNPHTLIPRPDSECLADEAVALIKGRGKVNMLDIGTGTGCLLLSVLTHAPEARGAGTDISEGALMTARRNAARMPPGVAERAAWFIGSCGEAAAPGIWDIVLANPPYIPQTDRLSPDVAEYEPHGALFAGADGLDALRQWLPAVRRALRPQSGTALIEFGSGQEIRAGALAEQADLRTDGFLCDGTGRIRAMRLRSA